MVRLDSGACRRHLDRGGTARGGVSRGSLYHHFAGKDALFLAVLEQVGKRIDAEPADAMRDAPDGVAALKTGCLAWIRMAALGAAVRAGSIRTEHVDVFAHALHAAVNEVALLIAVADDPDSAVVTGAEALTERRPVRALCRAAAAAPSTPAAECRNFRSDH